MENPNKAMIDQDRCDYLRWKGLFVDGEESLTAHSAHVFWCLHTQQPFGPDGKQVDEYECNETRKCYRPL